MSNGSYKSFVYDKLEDRINETTPDIKNITIGVFFDGTLNNKTNIVKLQELYKTSESKPPLVGAVYIEGIETVDKGGDDTLYGPAFGNGSNGIRGKIFTACEKISALNIVKKDGHKIQKITFDIFGFSRGAAAARSFAYEVKRKETAKRGGGSGTTLELEDAIDDWKYEKDSNGDIAGMLGYILKKNANIDLRKVKIEVRYVGLFDTVASYVKKSINFPHFEEGAKLLHLNDGIWNAKRVIHLEAIDEHRKNFAITPVTGINTTTIKLPGVHSDIGGGYSNNTIEKIDLKLEVYDLDKLTAFHDQLIEERWYNKGDLTIISKDMMARSHSSSNVPLINTLIGNRRLSNLYALIPLSIMYTSFNKEKEIFNKTDYDKKHKIVQEEEGIKGIRSWLDKKFSDWEKNFKAKFLYNNKLDPNHTGIDPFVAQSIDLFFDKTTEIDIPEPKKPSDKEVIYYIWQRINKTVYENESPLKLLHTAEFIREHQLEIVKKEDFNTVIAKKQSIMDLAMEQIFIRLLRHKHLHWSAHYGGEFTPHEPSNNRKREMHRG